MQLHDTLKIIGKERTYMSLFGGEMRNDGMVANHEPKSVRNFTPEKIFLSKGSMTTERRRRYVESIISLYSDAEVIECLNIPHNQIDLHETNPLRRLEKGKKTLVFGEHKSAVRFSDEEGNTCPNYWHFSPYGFCPFGCKYCYLAGTRGVWHSPTVKIFVNLDEIIGQIDKTAKKLSEPTAFYLGKLQDGLALDPLTGYSKVLIPFFARHELARQVVLTKSANVDNLLNLEHNRNTTLSWSLNPPEIAEKFDENTPSVEARLEAMKKSADAGYPVRAVIMPVIPVENWEKNYSIFVENLVSNIPIERLTIGGICIYRNARQLMEEKISETNCISCEIEKRAESADGRERYSTGARIDIYRSIYQIANKINPELKIALCLEEKEVWNKLNLSNNIGKCNCVL